MDMIIIKKDTNDWELIWDMLAKHPINEELTYPTIAYNNGEEWQYMGSYRQDKNIISEFRHRNHPKTNDVYKLLFNHSITDDSIDKVIKIK